MITDARGITFLTNDCDTNGRVIQQTQADLIESPFAYSLERGGTVVQTDVTNPRGQVRRVTTDARRDTKGMKGTKDTKVLTG